MADQLSETEQERADLYNNESKSFQYDLRYYCIVTEEDYQNNWFNGGHHGYASKEITEYFES